MSGKVTAVPGAFGCAFAGFGLAFPTQVGVERLESRLQPREAESFYAVFCRQTLPIAFSLRKSALVRAQFTPQIPQCVPNSLRFSPFLLNSNLVNQLIGYLVRNLED